MRVQVRVQKMLDPTGSTIHTHPDQQIHTIMLTTLFYILYFEIFFFWDLDSNSSKACLKLYYWYNILSLVLLMVYLICVCVWIAYILKTKRKYYQELTSWITSWSLIALSTLFLLVSWISPPNINSSKMK
jgi:prepilin signal peptidase PulO-like enzyme (type II secretory pathway)